MLVADFRALLAAELTFRVLLLKKLVPKSAILELVFLATFLADLKSVE
jgi:hypothetical protein